MDNKDVEAPIVSLADHGLETDMFTAVPDFQLFVNAIGGQALLVLRWFAGAVLLLDGPCARSKICLAR